MGAVSERWPGIVEKIPGGGILVSTLDAVINWSRSNSLWPLAFGTKCCAIEALMATGASHQDIARFGSEVARPSPRQSDMMVVAGTIVRKMAPRVRLLYEQMAEPRYVIAVGSCAISGGPFLYYSYSVVRGVDEVVPVDVYVPGCPPRPEAFFWGLLTLQRMIRKGETLRRPGIRRKPVRSALPQGVTPEQVRQELWKLLEEQNEVNVAEQAAGKPWMKKVLEWTRTA